MILLDSLLIGGIKFVLGKLVDAVDAEMNDENRLREDLLAAQMQVELGEMSGEEFAGVERALLARLREISEEREAEAGEREAGDRLTVVGIDTFDEEGAE
jgi:hypothetical protein